MLTSVRGICLTLQLCEIAVLFLVALGSVFYELQEEPQGFTTASIHVRVLQADSESWIVFRDYTVDDNSLYPDLAIVGPKPNF